MAASNIYVGLEIGTSKVCIVVGEVRSDGAIKILGVGQHPSAGCQKRRDCRPETVQTCLHDALMRAEERSDVEVNTVFLAVTGSHIQSLNNRGTIRVADEQMEITHRGSRRGEEDRPRCSSSEGEWLHSFDHSALLRGRTGQNSRIRSVCSVKSWRPITTSSTG